MNLWKDLDGIRLGELVVARGLATMHQVEEALAEQRKRKRPIGQILAEQGLLTTEQLSSLLLEQADLSGAPCAASRAGKYLMLHILGRGGMGTVWKAWDTQLRRPVALKVLHRMDDAEELARFLREAQIAARLSHPSIVPVHEILEIDGMPAIAMGLVEGRALHSGERLAPQQAATIIRDVARAVHVAHQIGVVHRDLKPENLMVDAAGRVYVLDFGVAKAQRSKTLVTASGILVGTPAYMSPEQAMGKTQETGPASDVYSLGATLYALATGRPPFDARDLTEMLARVVTEEPRRPDVPRDLETIILRAMQKAPADRYATAAALAEDLERFLLGEPVRARRVGIVERAWRLAKRNSLVTAAVGSLVAVLAGTLVVTLVTRTRYDRRAAASLLFEEGKRYYDDARLLAYRSDATMEAVERLVERAKPPLRKAAETDPAYAEPEHYLGRCHALVGSSGAATRHLSEAIRRSPAYLEPYLDRAVQDLLEAASYHPPRPLAPERAARAQADFERYGARREEPHVTALAQGALAYVRGDGAQARALLEPLADEPRLGDYVCLLLGMAQMDRPHEAEKTLRRALDRQPLSYQAHWQVAVAQMRGGRMAEAVVSLGKSAQVFRRLRGPFLARQAIALLYLDRRVEGRRCLDDALALPDEPDLRVTWRAEALATRARLSWTQQREDEAQADARAALAVDPACMEGQRVMLDVEVAQGAFDAALQRCDEIERIDPRCGFGWIGRAQVHEKQGDLDRALETLDRAIAAVPGEAELRVRRAAHREDRGLVDQAAEDLHAAIKLHPGWMEPHIRLAHLWERAQQRERGLQVLEEALRTAPQSARLLAERSMLLTKLGRPAEALADARAADAVEPDAPDVKRALALALELAGQPEQALEAARAALRMKPDAANYVLRARLHETLHHRDEFFADVEQATKLGSRNEQIWEAHAYHLRETGRYGDMVAACRRLIELAPKEARHWYNLGTALRACRRLDDAVEALVKARDMAPRDPHMRVQLGEVFEQTGRGPQAADEWEEAVRLKPSLEETLRPKIEKARRN